MRSVPAPDVGPVRPKTFSGRTQCGCASCNPMRQRNPRDLSERDHHEEANMRDAGSDASSPQFLR
jgi:hypothetical protein